MQKINKKILKDTYGIDLPIGRYIIEDNGDFYNIYYETSNTEGCLLPVSRIEISSSIYGINSKLAFDNIMKFKTNIKSLIIIDNVNL